MKGAVLESPGKLSLKELPRPFIGKSEVLIKVQWCGICGSDLELFKNGLERVERAGLERSGEGILGHEFSGDIVEVGMDVKTWKVGDRVVVAPSLVCGDCYWCRKQQYHLCLSGGLTGVTRDGGFAGFVKSPEYQLYNLPPEITYEEGALVEPLSVALHGLLRSNWKPGKTVAILGCGSIGLLVGLWARGFGADRIIATEVAVWKMAVAETIADVLINPQKDDPVDRIIELTGGIGADIVFECTGNKTCQAQALNIVRRGGQVIILGISDEPNPLDFCSLAVKEITVKGSFCYNSLFGTGEFKTSINFLKNKRIDVNPLVTSKIPLRDILEKGFKKMAAGNDIKILVNSQDA